MHARQEEAKRKAAAKAAYAAQRAAQGAARLWERLSDKGKAPYLDRKQIVGIGGRYGYGGRFMVPMRTLKGLVGLQIIYPEKQHDTGRDKAYWPYGMQKEGAFCLIGPRPEPGEPVLIAEGTRPASACIWRRAVLWLLPSMPATCCRSARRCRPSIRLGR